MPTFEGSDLGCLGCGFLPPDCGCDWDDCAAYQEALANPLPAHVAPLWTPVLRRVSAPVVSVRQPC